VIEHEGQSKIGEGKKKGKKEGVCSQSEKRKKGGARETHPSFRFFQHCASGGVVVQRR